LGYRQVLITASLLSVFAVIGTGLVAYTYDNTRERILANERAALMRSIHEILPPDRHDNNLFEDRIKVRDEKMLGTAMPVTVYRARMKGKPVAVILSPVAPNGYNGSIKLLVGINYDGTVAGVRVLAHRETPGLGDAIDEQRSNWILGFTGDSIGNPPLEKWEVRKDGGVFDQFTGATITPRAVVRAVRQSLLYYARNRERLFASAAGSKAGGAQEIRGADAATPAKPD
jgi:electron transport complex protein RnfG